MTGLGGARWRRAFPAGITRARAAAVAATFLGGSVIGAGIAWNMAMNASQDGEPVRAVRSPCGTVDPGVLAGLHVSHASDSDLDGSSTASATCVFAKPTSSDPWLEVEVSRSGSRSEDTDPGKGTNYVTRTGVEVARERYGRMLRPPGEPGEGCAPVPVVGVAEEAATCTGADRDGSYHLTVARGGDLIVTVRGRETLTRDPGRLGRTAATVLEASR